MLKQAKVRIRMTGLLIIAGLLLLASCSATKNEQPVKDSGSADSGYVASEAPPTAATVSNEPDFKPEQLAFIQGKDIYLYSQESEGVTLQVGDKEQSFDWIYATPRDIPPHMKALDYDGDGGDELAVDLYMGSGTGVSVEQLHVIELNDTGLENGHFFKDYVYIPDVYLGQLHDAVAFSLSNDDDALSGQITIGDHLYTVNLEPYKASDLGPINEGLVFGSIVRFTLEDKVIKAEFGAGITAGSAVSPQYIGVIQGEVLYSDGQFQLTNIQFAETESIQIEH
ncbi:hypothetical protein [Paenibacillus sp. 2TAB19]|uniref:hypothetical protein n=1 Tax=Paenibacillus sp. 2TAB19 TaxID=3233003 RepID=UPI003F98769B